MFSADLHDRIKSVGTSCDDEEALFHPSVASIMSDYPAGKHHCLTFKRPGG